MKQLADILLDIRSKEVLSGLTVLDPLEWKRPNILQKTFELSLGADCIARIDWSGSWDDAAIVTCGYERWTFRHEGFLHARVRVIDGISGEETAVLQHKWGRDSYLLFPDGSKFTWSVLKFWKGELGYKDANGNVLLRIKPGYVNGRKAGELTITPQALELPNLALLITLGWYLMVRLAQTSDASTTFSGTANA